MIRRLFLGGLTCSALALPMLSGCGGSSSGITAEPVDEAPAPPLGFQDQQKAIGGNMMDPRSVTQK